MRASTSPLTASSTAVEILLVDDHKMGLAARRSILEELGYRITTAASAAEALETFENANFDLIVTDYRMPRMNGIELIQKVRVKNESVPVILVSGVADTLGLSESNTGANVVIQKSANEVNHLIRAVSRLLRRKTPRKPPGSVVATAPKARRKTV
jgi:CheY-like chemotaxis protein